MADPIHPVPCLHLDEGRARCERGHALAGGACGPYGGCADYVAGLNEAERTRCEVWTRVMGYHRPVAAFNPGKQAEHRARKYFIERPGDLVA